MLNPNIDDQTKEIVKTLPIKNYEVLSILLYVIHIGLNLAQIPAIKYFYLLEVLVFLILALKYSWKDLFIPTIVFFFIEGQGRVLGQYNPFSRVVFDAYLFILVARHYVEKKAITLPEKIPIFFKLVIIGHFGWYIVQFFNVNSVGPLGPLVATKIYIFPIFMFFMFLDQPLEATTKAFNKRYLFIVLILILQFILIFFQISSGDTSVLNLSSYYSKSMDQAFTGEFFRPYGTSFVPGGISIYIALSTAFLFITKTHRPWAIPLNIITTVLLLAALFVLQVRVGLILAFLVISYSSLIIVLRSKKRVFGLIIFFLTLSFVPIFFDNILIVQEYFPEVNLKKSIERIQDISNTEDLSSKRASFDLSLFATVFMDRLEKAPLGLGPGRTGAAAGMFKDIIEDDPIYDLAFSWSLDNLYISLVIDLGIGMIFYTMLIVGLPLYTFWRSLIFWQRNKLKTNITLISLGTLLVTLLTSWGGLSIPYNPVSFFFWFWLAHSINSLDRESKLEM